VGPKDDGRVKKLRVLAENLTLHVQLLQPVTLSHHLPIFIRFTSIFIYVKTRTISVMIYREVKI